MRNANPDQSPWQLACFDALLNARPDVVYGLLSDIGGWRIWNDAVEFAETENSLDSPLPIRGMFYLTRFPYVRWHMQVERVTPDREVSVVLRLAGILKVQLRHTITPHDNGMERTASKVRFEVNVLGQIGSLPALKIPRRGLRLLMRHYARDGLKGLAFAARQIQQGQDPV